MIITHHEDVEGNDCVEYWSYILQLLNAFFVLNGFPAADDEGSTVHSEALMQISSKMYLFYSCCNWKVMMD